MSCKFNAMIDCRSDVHDCSHCGWNPDVHKMRLKNRGVEVQTQEVPEPQSMERFVTVYESNEDGVGEVRLFRELDKASAYIADEARNAYDKADHDTTTLDISPMLAYIEDGELKESWSVHRVTI